MRNFYIVKDQKDLLSGNIIPRKVVGQLPGGALGPMVFPGHMIVPKPITKSRELVYNVPPQGLYSPVLSPVSSPVMPRLPGLYSPSSPVLTRAYSSPYGNVAFSQSVYPLGVPIVKLSTAARLGERCKIEITFPNNTTPTTLFVPLRYTRDVIKFIYKEIGLVQSGGVTTPPPTATPAAPATPATPAPAPDAEVTIKIVVAGNEEHFIKTTVKKMLEIIKKIKEHTEWGSTITAADSTANVSYRSHGLNRYGLSVLLNNLLARWPYYRRYYG